MFETMRRLYPRGAASRGVVVDAEGAMLGPDCILVSRTPDGHRCIAPDEGRAIQAMVFGQGYDPDWLFEQSRRIAQALDRGETALAQIYGLRIPIGELDGVVLRRLAVASPIAKANFNPNEPRDWHGRWTTEGTGAGAQAPSGASGGGSEGEVPHGAGSDKSPPLEYTVRIISAEEAGTSSMHTASKPSADLEC